MKKTITFLIEKFFALCAVVSLLALMIILGFLLKEGLPPLLEIGFSNFLLGQAWQPTKELYGIFPMIIASILATFGAIVIGGLIGLFTALYMAEVASEKTNRLLRPMIQLLAGIPSVVYGFFGLVLLVPLIADKFGGPGNSMLATILILSVMILPTLASISETALRAVPKAYREGSLALGASPMETLFKVTLPAAKSGIIAAFILAVGRAVGETMAVILVSGNRPMLPKSLLDPIRPMTATIAMEMSYATGLHQESLFAIGVVLLIFVVMLNLVVNNLLRGDKKV
jgi:phosphate transport system permease protein